MLPSRYKGEYANIVKKYKIGTFSTNFKLDENEGKYIKSKYNSNLHILVRCTLSYLLAQSAYHNESKLFDDCTQLINMYFENVSSTKDRMSEHNIITVIYWTILKFPNQKSILNSLLMDKLLQDDNIPSGSFRCFSLADCIMKERNVRMVLTKENYKQIYDKYYVSSVDTRYVYVYLDFYKDYLDYLNEADKKEHKNFLRKYCNFALNVISLIDYVSIPDIYEDVRNYMDKIGEYSDSDYSKLDSYVENSVRKMMEGMKETTLKLPEKEQEQLESAIRNSDEFFASIGNAEKLERIIIECFPISKKQIEKNNECKMPLSNLFNSSAIRSDGRVICYSKLTESQAFSMKATEFIDINIQVFTWVVLNPFFKSFSLDESAKELIEGVLKNNKLISEEKTGTMKAILFDFFSLKFEHSVYDLCQELEDCLRYYFKNEGMNIHKRDGSGDYIGLSGFFNNNSENSFRDKLLETIDEDFYFTLKWLLTDDYGFGLRNRIAHRYNSENLYKKTYSIFTYLQIIRLIWGFQR